MSMPKPLTRLLITGATGNMGKVARDRLGHLATTLRLASRSDLGEVRANEEHVVGNLADPAAVAEMVADCDGILHLGGQSVEADWATMRAANLDGMYHLYEATRKHGKPRILYASSNHAIGFHSVDTVLDADATTRPDSLYGVSKVFGEALARMYFDKYGIETACVRIGSCWPKPKDHRMLSTWLSANDFVSLCERVFSVAKLGCPIIYGVSANKQVWWDNSKVDFLGWQPKDSSDQFRTMLEQEVTPPPPDSVEAKYQGGVFCTQDIIEK